MKLVKLKIVNFGQFSNFTVELPNSHLNAFYGVNEAGKSTIVAFIKQILFGFHLAKHASDFFEDYKPLAHVSPMGGALFFKDDQQNDYELERLYASGRGSKTGTLIVKRNNQVVPENIFFDQIKNIDGDFYADSFIFNQDMLGKIDKIQQSDLLEHICYLGAANSDKLIDLRNDFAKKASNLFKKAGTVPPLNRLLKELQEKRINVNKAENEFIIYQNLAKEYTNLQEQQNAYEEDLFDLQKEYSQLERLENLIPSYRELLELKNQVEPVNFDEKKYHVAQTLALKIQNLQDNKENLQQRIDQLGKVSDIAPESKRILQERPELLQWQSEYKNCKQEEYRLQEDQQELLAISPELNKIANFNQAEVINLQRDYQKLPSIDQVSEKGEAQNHNFLFLGIFLIILGLILFVTNSKIFGGLILIAAILLIGWQQKQQREQRVAKVNEAHNVNAIKQQHEVFYQKYGLSSTKLDLTGLLSAWRQLQLQKQKKATIIQQEAELLGKMQHLADQISKNLGEPVEYNFSAVSEALNQLEEKIAKINHYSEVKADLQSNLIENNELLAKTNALLQTELTQAQVENMTEYANQQVKNEQQTALKIKIDLLNNNLNPDIAKLKELTQNAQAFTDQLTTLAQKIAKEQKQISASQNKIAEIKVKMATLASSTAVFSAQQELANTQAQFKNLSAEYLSNLSAAKWISQALNLASNERFPKMLITAKEYLQLLTNNRYNDIQIEKKLAVNRYDGKKIKVQYLSRGTSEQLYFALKLAFIEQIKDQINMPILIDDSFVNFDEQRTEQITQLLNKVAQSNQVLIFTAQANLATKLQHQPLTFTRGN